MKVKVKIGKCYFFNDGRYVEPMTEHQHGEWWCEVFEEANTFDNEIMGANKKYHQLLTQADFDSKVMEG